MSTSREVCDPAHDWLGCEAMLSVPPFGLKPPDDAFQEALPEAGDEAEFQAGSPVLR